MPYPSICRGLSKGCRSANAIIPARATSAIGFAVILHNTLANKPIKIPQ
jgi:hypothetical protein